MICRNNVPSELLVYGYLRQLEQDNESSIDSMDSGDSTFLIDINND